jgi:hypothetical protein
VASMAVLGRHITVGAALRRRVHPPVSLNALWTIPSEQRHPPKSSRRWGSSSVGYMGSETFVSHFRITVHVTLRMLPSTSLREHSFFVLCHFFVQYSNSFRKEFTIKS